ncbi:MAG TPA: ABC transporter ATP-binding protein [Dongiaceae bacterium]|jgi:peptide/nickel transport system ATP-binding protein|nr:ABC transporter ATP-binding protein [Dongiaceae bacterium]
MVQETLPPHDLSSQDLLTVRGLKIVFDLDTGVLEAVRGIDFRVPHGKTVALVGESGSGKSVVAQAIMGILPKIARISAGQILFDRSSTQNGNGAGIIDIAQQPRNGPVMRQIRGGAISIIFQEPMTSLSPVHTIGDQIGEALRLHRKVSGREVKELVTDILRLVGFADPRRGFKTYPFELSGGLRQRAMIAMALICRPTLLIADEPTTALDVTIQAQILKLMIDLQKELQMALLLITHDLGVVANVADEIVVMYHGEVMESGTMEDLFQAPEHPYLQALLRAVPRFGMAPGERLTPIREIPVTDGKMFAEKNPWPEGAGLGTPLLLVENVSKSFAIRKGGFFGGEERQMLAVDDVSFEVKRGECLGLVGESGCGKTTLSKIIMRAITPDTGRILFNEGTKLTETLKLRGAPLQEFRKRIQFVFQDPIGSLNPRMSVYDIITEPLVIHGVGNSREREEIAKELMALVGLDTKHLRRYPHSFSGGQRQRIGIARAIALRPDIVICDEPVSALDVSIQAQILNLLKDLQAKLGLTYIFISHNLAVVEYIADRIMVMCAGRLVEMAPADRLFQNPVHPYTRALLAAVPDPSLTCRLNFDRLMEGKASIPSAWPAPFTIDPDRRPGMVEVYDGHWVRAGIDVRSAA